MWFKGIKIFLYLILSRFDKNLELLTGRNGLIRQHPIQKTPDNIILILGNLFLRTSDISFLRDGRDIAARPPPDEGFPQCM